MQILVLNSGSSSIKFQLFNMPKANVLCAGLVERIGLENSKISYTTDHVDIELTDMIRDHKDGLQRIASLLLDQEKGVIKVASEIAVVGHRVVHGGSTFASTVVINDEVKQKIKDLSTLAPLHNPANLQGILVAEEIFSTAKQVAVFDTTPRQGVRWFYRFLTMHQPPLECSGLQGRIKALFYKLSCLRCFAEFPALNSS